MPGYPVGLLWTKETEEEKRKERKRDREKKGRKYIKLILQLNGKRDEPQTEMPASDTWGQVFTWSTGNVNYLSALKEQALI